MVNRVPVLFSWDQKDRHIIFIIRKSARVSRATAGVVTGTSDASVAVYVSVTGWPVAKLGLVGVKPLTSGLAIVAVV